jgi:major membrane immunogen (membrane-anchored lipoprotein)
MKIKIIFVITLALIQTACGGSKSDSAIQSDEYAYNYTENGCSTGDRSASSKEEFCKKLADNNQNRNDKGQVCAYSIRERQLRQECPGYVIHD